MARKKKRKKKNKIVGLIFIILVVLFVGGFFFLQHNVKEIQRIEYQKKLEKLEQDIKSHYSTSVKVNTDAKLYIYTDEEYLESGTIKNGEIISLDEQVITYQDEYFKIKELGDIYYINYKDVIPTDDIYLNNDRYKKYIPFNENIVTNDNVNFYDQDDKLIYNIRESLSLPIIIKYGDKYGVVFNDRLLIVKNDDVKEIVKSDNTNLSSTNAIAVLNYHFFYDETKDSERKDCNQIICHSKSLFESHLKYFKDNNIFTPTMEEYEMWYDKKINLPKSVLITIDDGWRMQIGIDLLEQYKLNGTVFLITSWFKEEIKFLHDYEYVHFHSHGDNLHNQGECPGGQGGAIKCASKSRLLDDLALSRKKLEGSTFFCYPFYEYNSYSISVLKEAGFTMAFAGGGRSTRNSNRYAIPRYVVYNNTSTGQLKSYIG